MAYETETENVKNYYSNLLILQYRNKPKASATIKLGAGVYLADGLIFELNDILNINTAQGAQLDLIGQILGCPRNIYGFPSDNTYFSFEKLNALGYSDVNALSLGLWKQYRNSTASIYSLRDYEYIPLLKFKAVYNIKTGSWANLDNLYYRFFGDELNMVNNKDLSVTYQVSQELSTALKAAIYLGYIMPPMGISYSIDYI